MTFVSASFACLFSLLLLARVTIGRRRNERAYLALILAASLLAYAWHVPAFLGLLLASSITDYLAARVLDARRPGGGLAVSGRGARAALLVLSVSTNLALLFAFKYLGFFQELLSGLGRWTGHDAPTAGLAPVLPMGISFYTFAAISYTVDVYRGELRAVRGYGRFLLFLSFLPHLVAGPIVRGGMFLPQIDRRRRLAWPVLERGAFLIVRGLFLKVVCADNLATLLGARWSAAGEPGARAMDALGLAVLFAGQIFYDFEGYTSLALGTANLLGFQLPPNFDNPYLACSFREFWQRWHISLSRWLRDYLYLPLGGNRGSQVRTMFNLMVVMLLGGLWHGAKLTFVLWGAVHGFALALERLVCDRAPGRSTPRSVPRWLLVQSVVVLAWIPFRSGSIGETGRILRTIVAGTRGPPSMQVARAAVLLVPLVLMHLRGISTFRGAPRCTGRRWEAVLAGAMLAAVMTFYGRSSAFLYFQF